MPPLVFSPLAKIVFGVLGSAALVGWVIKEMQHLSEELERVQEAATVDPAARQELPTLRRDPRTGDWRLI
jgi:hypothetical protein